MVEVLVVGGGIAGCAAALALHKAGIATAVYEAHPTSSRDAGAFLTLASNGMRALRQIDADRAVADVSSPLTAMRVCDSDGAELISVPLGDGSPATRYRYLTRSDLCEVLQQEVRRRGIPIRWGKRLVDVRQDGSGITALFADGMQAHGSVPIGADGVRSTVRILIDPAAPGPRYVGQRVYYGYSADIGLDSPPDCFQVIRGATAFGYLVSAQRGIWWFARSGGPALDHPDTTGADTERWRRELTGVLRRERAPSGDIVRAAHRIMAANAWDLPHVRSWHRDGMLLIGDAAHAASPATGQGASMALEDAVVLAKALRDHPNHSRAFTGYERLRRGRVEANVAASAAASTPRRWRGRQDQPPRLSPGIPDETVAAQLDWNTPLPR